MIILAFMLAQIIMEIPSMLVSMTINTNTSIGMLFYFFATFILSTLSAIFMVGHNNIWLHYTHSEVQVPIEEMWYGFKGRADEIIIAYFLIYIRLFVCFLPFGIAVSICLKQTNGGTLAFLAVAALFSLIACTKVNLDYSQVFFLLIDHPEKRPVELLKLSKQIMQGNRLRLLYIQLSFIGMYLLVAFTFGFASFWVTPYIRMTLTELYNELAPAACTTAFEAE